MGQKLEQVISSFSFSFFLLKKWLTSYLMNLLIITVLHYLSNWTYPWRYAQSIVLCCALLFFSLSLSLSLVQKHFSYVNNACRFSLVLWSLLCTMSPGPNSSAIALCLVLLHLLWVYPPHKLHLMVKEVEAHEVLVENDWGFWALLFVFENLFISTSILWSCWGGGGGGRI